MSIVASVVDLIEPMTVISFITLSVHLCLQYDRHDAQRRMVCLRQWRFVPLAFLVYILRLLHLSVLL